MKARKCIVWTRFYAAWISKLRRWHFRGWINVTLKLFQGTRRRDCFSCTMSSGAVRQARAGHTQGRWVCLFLTNWIALKRHFCDLSFVLKASSDDFKFTRTPTEKCETVLIAWPTGGLKSHQNITWTGNMLLSPRQTSAPRSDNEHVAFILSII